MSAAVTLIVSLLYFLRSYKIKKTYFALIFLLPFMPRYIGFGLGDDGRSLSLLRILLIITFFSLFIYLLKNKNKLSSFITIWRNNKLLIVTMFLYFFIYILTALINDFNFSMSIFLFDDFLRSIFIFILTSFLVNKPFDFQKVEKMIIYSYIIVLLLVLIESVLEFHIFSIFASDDISKLNSLDNDAISFRDGRFRVSSCFENSIVLGEYLVVLFPFVYFYLISIKRPIYTVTFVLIYIYAIYMTGSRAAILMSIVMFYIMIIFSLYKKYSKVKIIINIINTLLFLYLVYFIIEYIFLLVNSFTGYIDYDEQERSSFSRAFQYLNVFNYIEDSYWFGRGRINDFTAFFQILGGALDNNFLKVLAQSGFVGLLSYLLFNYMIYKTAKLLLKENMISISLIVSIILIILYQFLSAIPDPLIYLYLFTALLAISKSKYRINE